MFKYRQIYDREVYATAGLVVNQAHPMSGNKFFGGYKLDYPVSPNMPGDFVHDENGKLKLFIREDDAIEAAFERAKKKMEELAPR